MRTTAVVCLFWKVSPHFIVRLAAISKIEQPLAYSWSYSKQSSQLILESQLYEVLTFCTFPTLLMFGFVSSPERYSDFLSFKALLGGLMMIASNHSHPAILHNLHICSCQLSLKSHLNPFVKRARYANDIGTITHYSVHFPNPMTNW